MIYFILANLSFDMTDAKHLNCDSQSVSLCAHTNGQKYNHRTNGQAPRHKTFSEVLGENTNRALAKRWLKAGLLSQILAQPCPDKYDSIRSFQEVMRKDRMGGFTQDLVKRWYNVDDVVPTLSQSWVRVSYLGNPAGQNRSPRGS